MDGEILGSLSLIISQGLLFSFPLFFLTELNQRGLCPIIPVKIEKWMAIVVKYILWKF